MVQKPTYEELERKVKELQENADEAKQAEKALQESEKKYRNIYDNAQVGLYRSRLRDGKVVLANNRMAEIFGYQNAEECIAKYVATEHYVYPETRDKLLENVHEHGKFTNFEAAIKKDDGSIVWIQFSGILSSEEGYFEGVATEITERKQAEEALQESELWIRNIFKSLNETVFVITLDRIFLDMNEAALEMFGYTKEELLNVSSEIVHIDHEHYLEFGKKMKEVINTGGITNFQSKMRRKNGDIFPSEHTASLMVDNEEKPIGIVSVIRDLSEQKKIEEEKEKLQTQLQQAQKMEVIGTLAGGVAHDLNNILSGIVSYPELILLDLPEDSPLKNPILTIQKSGEKAAVIVQDLLTLARRGVAIAEIVNLNHIISEQLKSLEYRNLLSFHLNVKIETNLEKDLLNIKGSTAHLSKSFMNLISNAAEAMIDGGTIFISTENRYVDRPVKEYDHVEEGDYVIVTVSDTGVGMSSEDVKRIFEPFYTKKVMGRSGTGLGMAVVWGTVKDHKGYIDIDSTEGKGTTFTLYFPVTREEAVLDKSLLSIEDYMGKGETILVIDDVEEQRVIASGMLKKLGYSVTSVSSGEEAVEYLKNNPVDLLVLDMIMDPGIDGLETYKRILKVRPGQKAIIASGFSESGRVKEAKSLGVGAYVKKPYLIEKIGVVVRNELEK